mmetsp:Transcript_34576/g.87450  ORF Transcript_34576/g.87450 Transcript_34576/m.87450 type:complete len:127 (-) Transcript_34576:1732-2112(-)
MSSKTQSKAGANASVISKLLSPADATWKKDELMNVLFTLKIVVAIGFGCMCGLLPITGWPAFVGYIVTSMVFTLGFYQSYLQIDEEEFGGHGELLNEGQAMGLGAFALCWILLYTEVHSGFELKGF